MSLSSMLHDIGGAGQWLADITGRSSNPCTQASISLPEFPGLDVVSLDVTDHHDFTFTPNTPFASTQDPVSGLNFCNITVSYTHPGWNDNVVVTTYLPLEKEWNGRLLANGGGGFITGGLALSHATMIPGLVEGYAVTTTDGGHVSIWDDAVPSTASWALSSPGNVNWPNLVDFASVALHDMSTISKAVVKAFYGQPAKHSYFYGSSTGGRQGHMLAQRYPDDFDGLVAIFPAIDWTRFLFASVWPPFVMDKLNIYPPPCELSAFTNAAIASCDGLDGVEDGIISRMDLCAFDPHSVVGKEFDCDGVPSTFSSGGATIAKAAWDGPRSSAGEFQWYGFGKDAPISQPVLGPAATVCDDKGENCDAFPFAIPHTWAKYWLKKDPDFDMRRISDEVWDELFRASTREYNSIIGTEDPDLSGLRKSGSKMINWHGTADQAIPVNGSTHYYERVLAVDPSAQDYYRLFIAPGAGHCANCGLTPPTMRLLDIMVDWVESGVAPDTLPVVGDNNDGVRLERDICMYPRVQHYVGGDMTKVSSFTCV